MAIGTAAAIAAGASAIGGIASASASKKAASKAADTSLAVAQQNNALAREIYGQNKDILNPFVQRGNAAGDAINALLGLETAPAPAPAPVYTPQFNYRSFAPGEPFINYGGGGFNPFFPQQQQAPTPAPGPSAQERQENAFNVFRDSTGYQFRVNEGMDALNSGFAGRGVLRSGAAAKAAQEFGQNIASNEFGRYMGYLSNQQGVGLGGGSALAGVGQNYVNTVSANNNSAGTAAANAQLARGAANANMFSSIFGGLGTVLGSSF